MLLLLLLLSGLRDLPRGRAGAGRVAGEGGQDAWSRHGHYELQVRIMNSSMIYFVLNRAMENYVSERIEEERDDFPSEEEDEEEEEEEMEDSEDEDDPTELTFVLSESDE